MWTRSGTYSAYHSVQQSALKVVGVLMERIWGGARLSMQICMLGATFDVVLCKLRASFWARIFKREILCNPIS